MSNLIDINEVCKMLDVTSRTLRFYEDKGIIQSTKEEFSNRRKYSKNQIQQIRNVLVLRTLGLSIKTIAQLQQNDCDLKTAVLTRKAEIYASINTKAKEINLLNEAIAILENGNNIFNSRIGHISSDEMKYYTTIANKCTDGILKHDFTPFVEHLSTKMHQYMPENVFWTIWNDTINICGKFVSIDKLSTDKHFPNIIYQYIIYEKIGIRIKYVFYEDKIDGLWFNYYEL